MAQIEEQDKKTVESMDQKVQKCLDEMVGFQIRFEPEEFLHRFPQVSQAIMAFERRGYVVRYRPERKAGWGSRRRTEPAYIEVAHK